MTGTGAERILVHAPIGRDADLARSVLERAGLAVTVCPHIAALCRELHRAGVAVVTDEALTLPAVAMLTRALGRQPSWSDLPILVLTRPGVQGELLLDHAVSRMSVALIERPTAAPVLLGAVHAALRARRKQYEVRDLAARLEAADRDKGRFMRRLGHDLRTPLDALRTAVRLLDRGPSADARAARLLTLIERQSAAVAGVLDELGAAEV